ncbi:unnamed protein product [Ectocarpus sp. CCAP 1310/34]|nr:unnamed protein product [Ectocarpus sp. CCAP 1310/34]
MRGVTRPQVTEGPLVSARQGKRPQIRGITGLPPSRPRKEEKVKVDTGDLPRPLIAPGPGHISGCVNCGADVSASASALAERGGARCWLCGGKVTCSQQTRRCRAAALVCIWTSTDSSAQLVSECSSSEVVVSTPKQVPQSMNKEWRELEEEYSKLVGEECRSQRAELSSLLGAYFLSEAFQPSAYWDKAPAQGNPEGIMYVALKEWSGISSREESLVKNAVSASLETPLDRPRDVRAAEIVAVPLVDITARSDGDWGDLTAHGNGPTGHELLLALLYRVRKERVGSATVLVVSTTRGGGRHRDGARLTTGVFDKHSATAGDVQRVVKDARLVELGPHRAGVAQVETCPPRLPRGCRKVDHRVKDVVDASSPLCLAFTAVYAFVYDKGTSHTLAALLLLDMLKNDLGVPLWLYQTGDDVRLSGALAAAPSCHWLLVVSMGSVDVLYSAGVAQAGHFAIVVSRSRVSRWSIRQKDHGVWKAIVGRGVYTARSLFVDACCGDGRLVSVSWLKVAEGDLWLTRKTVIEHTERWPPPVAVRKAQVVG